MTGALRYYPELKQDSRSRRKKNTQNFLFELPYVFVSSSWKTVGCVMWFLLMWGCCAANSHSETIIPSGVLLVAKYALAALEMSCL